MPRPSERPPFLNTVLFLAIAAGVAGAVALLLTRNFPTSTALIMLGGGAIALSILHRIVQISNAPPVNASPDFDRTTEALREIQEALKKISAQLDDLPRSTNPAPAPVPTSFPPADPVANTGAGIGASAASFQQLAATLSEIRELLLLNDAQRQQRQLTATRRRRQTLEADAIRALGQREWAEAEQAIASLAAEFPDDEEPKLLRLQLAEGRATAEKGDLDALRARTEDLMAIANFEQAHAAAALFVRNFPQNEEGKKIHARVDRERDLYFEGVARQLYREIRADVEHRKWRRALLNAQRLLRTVPGHHRATIVRQQLATIEENAQIEERQEIEHRIHELLRSKRYPDALELAEQLMERFPKSPQAESLQELLPKLRLKAIDQDIEENAGKMD